MIGDITTYEAEDAEFTMPEDDLRNEFMKLSTTSHKDLAAINQETAAGTNDALDTLYKAISEKYGVNTQHKDFKTYMNTIAEETKLDKAINDAISAKVIDSLVTRTKTRIMASTAHVLERIQDLIEEEAATTGVITPELIGVAQKNLEWISALGKIRSEVTIQDPDKAIQRAISMDKREHPEKYKDANAEVTPDMSSNIAFIQQVLASIDESEKAKAENKQQKPTEVKKDAENIPKPEF